MADAGWAPLWSMVRGSGLDTGEQCCFIQRRIAFFGKLVALLAAGFFVVSFGINTLVFHVPPAYILSMPWTMAHGIGTFLMGALWAMARHGCIRPRILEIFDFTFVIGTCTAWAGMLVPGQIDAGQAPLLAIALTTLARAIIVPSKPGRTARLTTLAYLPLVLMVVWWAPTLPVPSMAPSALAYHAVVVINPILWATCVIVTATVTSRVIYGLRKTAREANQIGPYTLEEKLGAGGMGEVWRARHRMLVRNAAVKLIRTEPLMNGGATADVLLRRFEREARATASLRSPHTVQLFDFGQSEDGTLYYVMEMLVGMDLENLVNKFGPVPAERAIHILRQVCQSLEEAHRNGLTHRDVKPANIFVSRIGTESDFAKVLDFGLVRLKHDRPESSNGVKLTADGAASGTPAYMAPEIVIGETYDFRVDIYALGCVAYWLVTGKLVFEGGNAMKMMLDHAKTAPARPQSRTELPIPPALEQIIMECLEKDRDKRPASAAEVAKRLAAVELSAEWSAERAEKWWQTHMPSQTGERPVAEILLSREDAAAAHHHHDHGWRELRPKMR
jgi:eukaryotic-like serine/threonine-protein kinase